MCVGAIDTNSTVSFHFYCSLICILQIRELYGPLYSNRLVQMTTYETVVGEHKKLRTYLKIAEERKDAEMIRRWRAFVWEVLYPLDKEVLLNSHFG